MSVEEIVAIFEKNVKNKRADTSGANTGHDGKAGHWLETQMGVTHNASNEPDLLGFEMKNATSSKTTFGDWSPNYKIFKKNAGYGLTRGRFLEIFGKPNLEKNGRLSWSGEPVPKINAVNRFGKTLIVDKDNNILIIYSYSKDQRTDKHLLVPANLQIDDLIVCRWDADFIRKKLERKFNNKGWFKCLTNKEGIYTSIVFGAPITFETWIGFVKSGDVFFDSGMHQDNNRPYANWRATNAFWEKLIIESY